MGADTAPIGAKSDHYGKKSRHAQLRFAANSVTIAIDDLFSVALTVVAVSSFMGESLTGHLATLAALWGLAEWLVHRRRLALPGMAIVICMVVIAMFAVPLQGNDRQLPLALAAAGTLVGIAFYGRFRLPFALAVVAVAVLASLIAAVARLAYPEAMGFADMTAIPWVGLLTGVLVFVAAMWFDSRDRLRRTRLSDCAFWLHVVAAPVLTHSVIALLASVFPDQQAVAAAFTLLLLVVMALLAIFVDRRAFVVSMTAYAISAISFFSGKLLMGATGASDKVAIGASFALLGVTIVLLGVFWARTQSRVWTAGRVAAGPLCAALHCAHSRPIATTLSDAILRHLSHFFAQSLRAPLQ